MKKVLFSLLLIMPAFNTIANLPIKLHTSVGIGSFSYGYGMVNFDVDSSWKGYNLPRDGNTGIQIFANTGLKLFDRLHATVGAGYARYNDINGMLATGNLAYDILKTRLTPFVYANIGYSHFWNQYEGGTGTAVAELGLGGRFRIAGKKAVFLSFGNQIMQHNYYYAAKAGFTF